MWIGAGLGEPVTWANLLSLVAQVVQLFIRFLYRLASLNKDYAVVMCRLGTREALVKALDKHGTSLLLVTELRDLLSDCEKYASLYKRMTTSVLAGCIQVCGSQHPDSSRRSSSAHPVASCFPSDGVGADRGASPQPPANQHPFL